MQMKYMNLQNEDIIWCVNGWKNFSGDSLHWKYVFKPLKVVPEFSLFKEETLS